MIEDYKASGGSKKKPRALHELAASAHDQLEGEDVEGAEKINLLYSLLCHASEEDAAKILGPTELMSFVKWRKDGSKGYGKGGYRGGSGGGKGQTWTPTAGTAAKTSTGNSSPSGKGGFEAIAPIANSQATESPSAPNSTR